MAVTCEINLNEPADGVFIPGTKVEGVIKYAFEKDITITKIMVSLKGRGCLQVRCKRKKNSNYRSFYRKDETYVDIDHVIEDNEKIFKIGLHETGFSFQIPENVPPTLDYYKRIPFYDVRCIISYYIRIKFERPGIFTFNKHFKKFITLVSGITPRYPTVPTIYGEQKSLLQLLSSKASVINMKANVESCVITPGGKIELDYEVVNDSEVVVKEVEFKLIEVYNFKPIDLITIKDHEDVIGPLSKTSPIGVGETQKMHIVMNVPTEKTSIECSDMVSRDYYVEMLVVLPTPYVKTTLEIPVQIGDHSRSDALLDNQYNPSAPPYTPDDLADNQYKPSASISANSENDPPPSYCEVMKKHNEDDEKCE